MRLGPRARRPKPSSARQRGLSLLEVTIATGIVGVLIVASLETLGAAARASRTNANYAIGQALAQDLMSEIVNAHYAEPTETPATFGPEISEQNGSRAAFDDVDDYDGWSATPPREKTGSPRANRDGWRRDVAIQFAQQAATDQASIVDEGLKMITVSVYYKGQMVSQLVTLRADLD